jgi:hypothetical protein
VVTVDVVVEAAGAARAL